MPLATPILWWSDAHWCWDEPKKFCGAFGDATIALCTLSFLLVFQKQNFKNGQFLGSKFTANLIVSMQWWFS